MGSKQKNARGWAHLPPELLHNIAQEIFVLQFDRVSVPTDNIYAAGMSRVRALSASKAYDLLSFVCSRWYEAMSICPFWEVLTRHIYQADTKMWESLLQMWGIDPLAENQIQRKHFLHARSIVCGVCIAYSRRFNFALNGCTNWTFPAGEVATCKFHDQYGFCGVCLKDDNIIKEEPPEFTPTLSPVDDDDTWFGRIMYTCEQCRTTAYRQAMRQHKFTLAMIEEVDMDELFQNYRSFGEGALQSLCTQVYERRWLLQHTKIRDFSLQAVASERLLRGVPMADVMNPDAEEFVMLYTEPSIRELALREFMRCLILDGQWFSPLDVVELQQHAKYQHPPYWYNGQPSPFAVVHPTRQERKFIHWYYIIPSTEYKEILQSLWHQTMVDILETAFKNIIAEVTDSCLVDSKVYEFDNQEPAPGRISDPGQRLQSWSMGQVWERLMKSEYWVTGYNWRSRKLDEYRVRRMSDASSQSKSSSVSSESVDFRESPEGTDSTSKTTPSPPPPNTNKNDKSPVPGSPMEASMDLKSPSPKPQLPDIELTGVEAREVTSVPFVPESWEILPQLTRNWVTDLWVKSIHPFVACQCGICKRACKLQEEERLRGPPRKAPTGGIVINEPKSRKKNNVSEDEDDDDDDDDDLTYELESDDDDDYTMDVSMDEEADEETEARIGEERTPIQLVQQPATPDLYANGDPASRLTSRKAIDSTVTPTAALSPPAWRKRSSQELESAPSSPSSAKRRRLDSGDSKLNSPSPAMGDSLVQELLHHRRSSSSDPQACSSPPESLDTTTPSQKSTPAVSAPSPAEYLGGMELVGEEGQRNIRLSDVSVDESYGHDGVENGDRPPIHRAGSEMGLTPDDHGE
ncbi:hypothetical protein FRB91_009681 [Serendipita sp. 411]|nr:hypothetical protein FRB91_009681 [Serendipita sp. 411]